MQKTADGYFFIFQGFWVTRILDRNLGCCSTYSVTYRHTKQRYLDIMNFTAVTLIYPPFVERKDNDSNYEGSCFKLVRKLEKDLNFTLNIIEVKQFGMQAEDGTWTGMIGKIVDGNLCIIGCWNSRRSKEEGGARCAGVQILMSLMS